MNWTAKDYDKLATYKHVNPHKHMYYYVAILDGPGDKLWAMTLEGIRDQVKLFAYMGRWRIFELVEINDTKTEKIKT